jgi:hypothetical protein
MVQDVYHLHSPPGCPVPQVENWTRAELNCAEESAPQTRITVFRVIKLECHVATRDGFPCLQTPPYRSFINTETKIPFNKISTASQHEQKCD